MSKTDAIIKAQPIRFFDEFDTELIDETDLAQFAILYKTTDLIEFQANNTDELWFNQQFSNPQFNNGLTDWQQYNPGGLPAWVTSTCGVDDSVRVTKTAGQAARTLFQNASLEQDKWYRCKVEVCDITGNTVVTNLQYSTNGVLGGFSTLDTLAITGTGEYNFIFQWTIADDDVDVGLNVTGTGDVTDIRLNRFNIQEIDMQYVDCTTETATAITAEHVDQDYVTFSLYALGLTENSPYYFESSNVNNLGKSVQFIVTDAKFYQMQFSHTGDGVFGLKWSDFTNSTLTFGFKKLQIGQAVFENDDGQTYQNSSEQWRNLYSQINKKVSIATDVVPWYVHECLAYLTNVNNFTIDLNGDTKRFVKTADEYSPNYNGYEQAAVSFTCYEAEQSTGIVKNSGNI